MKSIFLYTILSISILPSINSAECLPKPVAVGDRILNVGDRVSVHGVLEVLEVDQVTKRVQVESDRGRIWLDSYSYCAYIPAKRYKSFKRGGDYLSVRRNFDLAETVDLVDISANGYGLVDNYAMNRPRTINLDINLETFTEVDSAEGFRKGDKAWVSHSSDATKPYKIKSIRRTDSGVFFNISYGLHYPPEKLRAYREYKWRFSEVGTTRPYCENIEGNAYYLDWIKIENTSKIGEWKLSYEMDDSNWWDSTSPAIVFRLDHLFNLSDEIQQKLKDGKKLTLNDRLSLFAELMKKSRGGELESKFQFTKCSILASDKGKVFLPVGEKGATANQVGVGTEETREARPMHGAGTDASQTAGGQSH